MNNYFGNFYDNNSKVNDSVNCGIDNYKEEVKNQSFCLFNVGTCGINTGSCGIFVGSCKSNKINCWIDGYK